MGFGLGIPFATGIGQHLVDLGVQGAFKLSVRQYHPVGKDLRAFKDRQHVRFDVLRGHVISFVIPLFQ